jgi:signal transduction histidine kinase
MRSTSSSMANSRSPGRRLATGSSVNGLLGEVGTSAGAISEIVKAVKSYSYLDQAPIQEVDAKESLETALIILRPKIKAGISITRDYADEVPHTEAYGSELNQVWTNIIDNALAAMQVKESSFFAHTPKTATSWSKSSTTDRGFH